MIKLKRVLWTVYQHISQNDFFTNVIVHFCQTNRLYNRRTAIGPNGVSSTLNSHVIICTKKKVLFSPIFILSFAPDSFLEQK